MATEAPTTIAIPAKPIAPGPQTPPLRTMSSIPRFPGSPATPLHLSASPLMTPPSSIFERSVQNSPLPSSPAIPAHITTENYIPPVLSASSLAITDTSLPPSAVEIVTHTSHQPVQAQVSPVSGNVSEVDTTDFSTLSADRIPDDAMSMISTLPPFTDPPSSMRRLSFISFADLINGEAAESTTPAVSPPVTPQGRRGSMSFPRGLSALARSVSPKREAGANTGVRRDMSPGRRSVAIFPGGEMEVEVESMAQALRRSASGEVGRRGRSYSGSPV